MALISRSLADGTLSSSQAQMYKVPQGKKTAVSSLLLYNPNATSETIGIYVRRGNGTIRQVRRIVLGAYESYKFDNTIMLSSEDALYGDTTSSCNYVLGGGEG